MTEAYCVVRVVFCVTRDSMTVIRFNRRFESNPWKAVWHPLHRCGGGVFTFCPVRSIDRSFERTTCRLEGGRRIG
jgi:hypothetical protein